MIEPSMVAKVRMLAFDIDGTLTDGCLYISENSNNNEEGVNARAFNIKDGYGLQRVLARGYSLHIISGRPIGKSMRSRFHVLGLRDEHMHENVADKLHCAQSLLLDIGAGLDNMGYMGDDIPDLPLLREVGISVAPADAVPSVKEAVDFVTTLPGGKGAVREFLDALLALQTRADL